MPSGGQEIGYDIIYEAWADASCVVKGVFSLLLVGKFKRRYLASLK